MTKSNAKKLKKVVLHTAGWIIAGVAIYFTVWHLDFVSIRHSFSKMNKWWIAPVAAGNFAVILLKAMRWRITLLPVKKISTWLMFKTLTIGFMANNILPARMGDILRIHMLGKEALLSRVTSTGTAISDRIVEGLSFLLFAAALTLFTPVPEWMKDGTFITLFLTLAAYIFATFYTSRDIKHSFLKKFQEGFVSLNNLRLFSSCMLVSLLSWMLQGGLILMVQVSFGVYLPLWSVVLVLVAVNLAIALPSAPGNIGTFEYACILAYAYLGVDKNISFLIGVTYHILQAVPVMIAGGIFYISTFRETHNTEHALTRDSTCSQQE